LSTIRIYIESTIPSYVVARPARDLLQAARQQLTRDWWDLQREKHELFTSQIVLDEIAAGERKMAQRRLELMAGLTVLDLTPAAEMLADCILHSGLLPAHADGDAAHIALATVHKLDILLTWNCRHIANAAIVGRLRRLVETQGHTLPEIYTPEELLGE
jgi:predicted nucleic acid-binding protein